MILYATKGKIKKVGNVQVNSLKLRGSGQNTNFDYSIPTTAENVNSEVEYSSSKTDQEYLSAVENGDIETAQRTQKNRPLVFEF